MDLSNVAAKFECVDPEDILTRKVFARFGRAMYAANCLESEIANDLVFIDYRAKLKPPMTRAGYEAGFDASMEKRRSETMGSLVKRLLAFDVPDEMRTSLNRGLEVRNRLAHHYFWERAGEFVIVPEGQLRMIDECDSALTVFEGATALLHTHATAPGSNP